VLTADYFDGRSTRVRVVRLEAAGEYLSITGEDIDRRVPFSDVKVDERLGRAPRRLRLADESFCVVSDLHALDTMLASMAHRDGWVDRIQRRARFVLMSLAACAVLGVIAYKWGLPWAAGLGAAHLPAGISVKISAQALEILDGKILLPSRISEDRQRTINAKFHALRLPEGGTAKAALLFRRSPQLGANAFTLPDGRIMVLDDLIAIIGDDRQILATLAHEAGHGHGNHGMRMLLQNSLVGAFLAFYVGDISGLLAIAPATLMQARYSREFEAQADDYAAAILRLNGMSPGLLADALDKLAKSHREAAGAGYLSSHPATDARMRHLRSQ
jgi:Zn-dependent protease with chaperone function